MAHVGQKRPRTWRLDSNDIIEEDVRDITRFVVLDESNVFEVGSVEWTADILGETIVRDPLISPETISEFIGQRKIPLSRTLNRIVEARKPQLLGSIAKLSSLPIFNLCDVLETLDSEVVKGLAQYIATDSVTQSPAFLFLQRLCSLQPVLVPKQQKDALLVSLLPRIRQASADVAALLASALTDMLLSDVAKAALLFPPGAQIGLLPSGRSGDIVARQLVLCTGPAYVVEAAQRVLVTAATSAHGEGGELPLPASAFVQPHIQFALSLLVAASGALNDAEHAEPGVSGLVQLTLTNILCEASESGSTSLVSAVLICYGSCLHVCTVLPSFEMWLLSHVDTPEATAGASSLRSSISSRKAERTFAEAASRLRADIGPAALRAIISLLARFKRADKEARGAADSVRACLATAADGGAAEAESGKADTEARREVASLVEAYEKTGRIPDTVSKWRLLRRMWFTKSLVPALAVPLGPALQTAQRRLILALISIDWIPKSLVGEFDEAVRSGMIHGVSIHATPNSAWEALVSAALEAWCCALAERLPTADALCARVCTAVAAVPQAASSADPHTMEARHAALADLLLRGLVSVFGCDSEMARPDRQTLFLSQATDVLRSARVLLSHVADRLIEVVGTAVSGGDLPGPAQTVALVLLLGAACDVIAAVPPSASGEFGVETIRRGLQAVRIQSLSAAVWWLQFCLCATPVFLTNVHGDLASMFAVETWWLAVRLAQTEKAPWETLRAARALTSMSEVDFAIRSWPELSLCWLLEKERVFADEGITGCGRASALAGLFMAYNRLMDTSLSTICKETCLFLLNGPEAPFSLSWALLSTVKDIHSQCGLPTTWLAECLAERPSRVLIADLRRLLAVPSFLRCTVSQEFATDRIATGLWMQVGAWDRCAWLVPGCAALLSDLSPVQASAVDILAFCAFHCDTLISPTSDIMTLHSLYAVATSPCPSLYLGDTLQKIAMRSILPAAAAVLTECVAAGSLSIDVLFEAAFSTGAGESCVRLVVQRLFCLAGGLTSLHPQPILARIVSALERVQESRAEVFANALASAIDSWLQSKPGELIHHMGEGVHCLLALASRNTLSGMHATGLPPRFAGLSVLQLSVAVAAHAVVLHSNALPWMVEGLRRVYDTELRSFAFPTASLCTVSPELAQALKRLR